MRVRGSVAVVVLVVVAVLMAGHLLMTGTHPDELGCAFPRRNGRPLRLAQQARPDQTRVVVDGRDADDVAVEQRRSQIVVVAPHRRGGLFGGSSDLRVAVTLPSGSELFTKLGSADLLATGRYAASRLRSGSGDLDIEELGDTVVETGSGDLGIDIVHGDLLVKSGSGNVDVRRLTGTATISTGSGDVTLGTSEREVLVKSGSGDVRVGDALTDLSLTTASGDVSVEVIRRGRIRATAVSGDVNVGVPPGVPVWTDIGCVSGRVSSTLDGAGQPEEGQDFIAIRATTVSGDIHLEQRRLAARIDS